MMQGECKLWHLPQTDLLYSQELHIHHQAFAVLWSLFWPAVQCHISCQHQVHKVHKTTPLTFSSSCQAVISWFVDGPQNLSSCAIGTLTMLFEALFAESIGSPWER